MSDYIRQHAVAIDYKIGESWSILNEIEQSIKQKIEAVGTPLKDWNIEIKRGILTGLNEAFIISKEKRDELISADPKSAEIIRPILRGRDIKRCKYNFSELYVITAYKGINKIIEEEYPAIYNHLKKYEKKLRQRGQVEGKQGKKGSNQHHWTELDNNISLEKLDDFSKQKIIFSEMVQSPQFYLDNEQYIVNDTVTFISGQNLDSLINYLNSQIIFNIYSLFYSGGGLGKKGVRVKKTFLEELPIPLVSIICDTSNEIEKKIGQILNLSQQELQFILDEIK
ncbi:MAG: hypothetical protein MRZ40_08330 [Ligilactobacillus animalis]|uniref:TaqI-like C-terminal specificity domain-containing protein n=1 Tax=Ligilactobacillus animalis TaxID=1605 RepID=UPI00242B6C71|nr:TaqI-like C-terminal specificity domain-containing protein [Ligilactobacillus animalis]MCI5942566.1 hypothetical protein [Ligilactobacillus animalis]